MQSMRDASLIFAEQSYLFLTDYARFSWIILWKKLTITYFFNSKERNIAFFTLFLNKLYMYCSFRPTFFPLPSSLSTYVFFSSHRNSSSPTFFAHQRSHTFLR